MGFFGKSKEKHESGEIVFSVPDMHCAHCEQNIALLLKDVPGIKTFKPDSGTNRLKVVLDKESPAEISTIQEKLAAGGYPASLS